MEHTRSVSVRGRSQRAADIADRAFDRFIEMMAVVAGLCVAAVAILTCAAVVFRYAGRPIGWSIEVTEYALLYITFLSAPWILRRGEHVRIDVLVENVPRGFQRGFAILGAIIGIASSAAVTYYGAILAYEAYGSGILMLKTLRVPRYLVLGVIPFGTSMLVLQFIRMLGGLLRRADDNADPLADGESGT